MDTAGAKCRVRVRVPIQETRGYFSFPTLPISLALAPAAAIHIRQGTGYVYLPFAAPTVRSVLDL